MGNKFGSLRVKRIEKPCKICGKMMILVPSYVKSKATCSHECMVEYARKCNLGRKVPKEQRKRISQAQSEEKSSHWKGTNVGYSALHKWVKRQLGIPRYCAYCQKVKRSHRQYNWANISKTYKRELSDWIRLCASCHKLYDNGKIKLNLSN